VFYGVARGIKIKVTHGSKIIESSEEPSPTAVVLSIESLAASDMLRI